MKKLFLLLVMGLFSLSISAQTLSSGLKAGINLGTANIREARNDWEGEGLSTGVHAGYFILLEVGPVIIQPEIYYTFTQANLKRANSGQIPETYSLDFHRLDVPLLAGFRPLPYTRVNFGPFASVLINANADYANGANSSMEDFANKLYNRSVWGWQAGVGVDILRFTLDARYETTVGDLRDQDFHNPTLPAMLPNKQSHRQFVFSLGYKL